MSDHPSVKMIDGCLDTVRHLCRAQAAEFVDSFKCPEPEPEDRSQGNYRLYSDESLSKLKFIRVAQAIGFTLEDVKALLGIHGGRTPSCDEVQMLIEERLADIDLRLKDLHHVKRVLASTLERCRETEQVQDCCQVIETLRGSS